MIMNELETYSKAVQLWGRESQVDMLVEECNELTEVLIRAVVYGQAPDDISGLVSEVVDVQIVLNQTRVVFKIALEEVLLSGSPDARELLEVNSLVPEAEWGDLTVPTRMIHTLMKNRRGKASDEDVVRMVIETQVYVNDLRTLLNSEEVWQAIKEEKLGYLRGLVENSERGREAGA